MQHSGIWNLELSENIFSQTIWEFRRGKGVILGWMTESDLMIGESSAGSMTPWGLVDLVDHDRLEGHDRELTLFTQCNSAAGDPISPQTP